MLSVFMVTCAGAILASAMPAATVSRVKGNYLNRAANFAQKEIELMKAQTYSNLTPVKLLSADIIDSTAPISTDTYSCNSTDAAVGDRVTDVLPNGSASVKVEQIDIELKRITVTVSWTEKGRNRSYSVGSLVAPMKRTNRRRRGATMIEVVVGAGVSVVTLIGGVGCFMAGMMSWMKGVGAMDSISKSQESVKMVSQQLREAMSVKITDSGNVVTYSLPAKNGSGEYALPLISDGIIRKFVLSNGSLTHQVGPNSRVIADHVLDNDPNTGSPYTVFEANNGTVTRQVIITLVTTRQGYRDNWTPSRARESVYLRNVPQLSR
jgi:hypothetical protein